MREGEPVVADADLASEADTPPPKLRRASWSTDADATSDAESPYRFTARRVGAESGLMQYRNRYYASGLGRFVSRDPAGSGLSEYADGLNLYQYVQSDPVENRDPDGEATITAEEGRTRGAGRA
ncbi:MAG: RHS repeat-associated core domain-containing protein [Planctomycetota bacterium]